MKAPCVVVQEWVAAYNQRDARVAAEMYHDHATNFQVALGTPSVDNQTILGDSISFFNAFPDNFTHVENLFEDGEWTILEWSWGGTWRGEFAGMPANGTTFTIHGCGFFYVTDDKIRFQRGYFDRATWFAQLGIPLM